MGSSKNSFTKTCLDNVIHKSHLQSHIWWRHHLVFSWPHFLTNVQDGIWKYSWPYHYSDIWTPILIFQKCQILYLFYLWVEHRLSTSGEDLPSYFAKRLPLCLLINKKKGSPMKGMHRDIWSCIGRRRNYNLYIWENFFNTVDNRPCQILALLRFVSRCFGGIDCEFVCLFFRTLPRGGI